MNKATRSNIDFLNMTIDSLGLPIKKEKTRDDSTKKNEDNDIHVIETRIFTNKVDADVTEKLNGGTGHDLNDQPLVETDRQEINTVEVEPNPIRKFDGQGDVEQWLQQILKKFDSIQLSANERNNFIPEILTGEAFIWYYKQLHQMPTFNSFVKNILYHYGQTNANQERLPSSVSPLKQVKQESINDYQETVMESLRNQMLISSLEKLPKFSGKSKQNVSKWLRDTQQTMHIFKLTDEEKLFLVSTCLEADAREWFFDNSHLFNTWTSFIQKLTSTFESAGQADISFNRLRHYQQGLNQDVRQYYFEIMKLCKEANPSMDDLTKLQYLKDGLKPSLRFDVLLKNPQSTEEFLEYAQKVEELKSLDEKDDIIDQRMNQKTTDSLTSMTNNFNKSYKPNQFNNNMNNKHPNQQHINATTIKDEYYATKPKPPYQCYKCGGTDHYIRNCPHFQ